MSKWKANRLRQALEQVFKQIFLFQLMVDASSQPNVRVFTCMRECAFLFTFVRVHEQECVSVCMRVCVCVCVSVREYLHLTCSVYMAICFFQDASKQHVYLMCVCMHDVHVWLPLSARMRGACLC